MQPLCKQYGGFSKKQKYTTMTQQSTSWYISGKKKPLIKKDTCTPMFIAALFTIAKIWKQVIFMGIEISESVSYNTMTNKNRTWLKVTRGMNLKL